MYDDTSHTCVLVHQQNPNLGGFSSNPDRDLDELRRFIIKNKNKIEKNQIELKEQALQGKESMQYNKKWRRLRHRKR